MFHPVKQLSDGSSFSVLFLCFFLLFTSSGVFADLICSNQTITVLAGDDVVLPCHLKPAANVSTVNWIRPDLNPEYIYVHKDGRFMNQIQNPSYYYRTSLFLDKLMTGNVSMKIFNVEISDAGKYRCDLPSVQNLKEAFIELIVGAVSTPSIEFTSNDDGSVVLQCKSTGWYPEPELVWLDAEGNLLFSGPIETIRGPDGLYNVSSRVTVTITHGNRFTCRVQQKKINQTRETQINFPVLFLVPQYMKWTCGIGFLLFIAAVFSYIIFKYDQWFKNSPQGPDAVRNRRSEQKE